MTHKRLPACLLLVLLVAPLAAQQGDKDAKTWDVATAAIGPTHAIAFETSEATWVNVDVSADGATVVFDILGDLYSMPIEGTGRASRPASRADRPSTCSRASAPTANGSRLPATATA